MITFNGKHTKILIHIGEGEENAVSMKELARLLGASDRDIRRMIENARKDGHIIASSEEGYFFPIRERELVNYCARTVSRIQNAVLAFAPAYRMLGLRIEVVSGEAEDDE